MNNTSHGVFVSRCDFIVCVTLCHELTRSTSKVRQRKKKKAKQKEKVERSIRQSHVSGGKKKMAERERERERNFCHLLFSGSRRSIISYKESDFFIIKKRETFSLWYQLMSVDGAILESLFASSSLLLVQLVSIKWFLHGCNFVAFIRSVSVATKYSGGERERMQKTRMIRWCCWGRDEKERSKSVRRCKEEIRLCIW